MYIFYETYKLLPKSFALYCKPFFSLLPDPFSIPNFAGIQGREQKNVRNDGNDAQAQWHIPATLSAMHVISIERT